MPVSTTPLADALVPAAPGPLAWTPLAAPAAGLHAADWYRGNSSETFGNHTRCVCGPAACQEVGALQSPKGYGYALRSCKSEQMQVVQQAMQNRCHATALNASAADGWPVLGYVANMDVAAQNLLAATTLDAGFFGCMQNTLNADPYGHLNALHPLYNVTLAAAGVGVCAFGAALLVHGLRTLSPQALDRWEREEQDFTDEHSRLLGAGALPAEVVAPNAAQAPLPAAPAATSAPVEPALNVAPASAPADVPAQASPAQTVCHPHCDHGHCEHARHTDDEPRSHRR